MGGVEYQVTKVDPTDPETKGMVYQVHKVSEEVAATLGGKVYRARIIKDPSDPAVAGKVYQIVLIGDPDDPAVKGKVYNAILTGGSEAVVVGPAVSPLALDDAVADTMEYVKAYGGTQQGLPSGYTQLDYIESTGTQYINTGVTPNQDTSIETKAQLSVSSGVRFFAAYGPSSNAPYYGVGFSGSGKWVNQTNTSNQVTNVNADTDLHTIYKNKNILYVDGAQIDDSGSGDFTSSYSIYLLAANIGGSVSFISAGKMYYAKIWDGNTLVRNFVPCRNASNVVGMYDTINGVFYQNAGTGSFVAGSTVVPTPTAPIAIVCNNGELGYSTNIANVIEQNITIGKYISAQGSVLDSVSNFIYSAFIPVKPNTTYTLGLSEELYYVTISEYTSADDSGFVVRKAGSTGGNTSLTITTGATTQYIRWGSNPYGNSNTVTWEQIQAINFMLTETATPLPYHPYHEFYVSGPIETIADSTNHTATCENLFSVGDYIDVQEILSGAITRNVGVMVLDGTESWQLATATDLVQFYTARTQGVIANSVSLMSTIAPYGCTAATRTQYDFGCYSGGSGNLCFQMKGSATLTTLPAWTQYLADQYAAGTPVIVIYPLATPTTESVTGQTLQVQDGDNTLTITQAGMDGLQLEAEYEKEGA